MGRPDAPVAVDAMGGDQAPRRDRRRRARAAAESSTCGSCSSGARTRSRPFLPSGGPPDGVELERTPRRHRRWTTSPRPRRARRRTSSLVRGARRSARARADAMVSAGNTGATMAAALLRLGRIQGVARPAIAVPIPVPGAAHPQLLSTPARPSTARRSGSCSSPVMGREYARHAARRRRADGRPALERRGAGQGRRAAQETRTTLLAGGAGVRRQRRGPRPHAPAPPTSSSPTASPATSRSRPSRARCAPLVKLVFTRARLDARGARGQRRS